METILLYFNLIKWQFHQHCRRRTSVEVDVCMCRLLYCTNQTITDIFSNRYFVLALRWIGDLLELTLPFIRSQLGMALASLQHWWMRAIDNRWMDGWIFCFSFWCKDLLNYTRHLCLLTNWIMPIAEMWICGTSIRPSISVGKTSCNISTCIPKKPSHVLRGLKFFQFTCSSYSYSTIAIVATTTRANS